MTQGINAPTAAQLDRQRDSAWQSQVARPLLIALQATCLASGLGLIVQIIFEDPALRFLPLLAFGAALVGVYSAHWLLEPAQRLTSKTVFALAELLVIFLLLRVLTWGLSSSWPTLESLEGWILAPWTFFDGMYLAVMLVCALAWHRARVVSGIFHQLALTPGELAVEELRRTPVFRFGRQTERVIVSRIGLVDAYVSQWLMGAIFLALCAAVTRVSAGSGAGLNLFATGVPPQIVVASVFYFLIGLILTSQARLAVLRSQWLQDGVDMPDRLPGRWHRFSLVLILVVGLLATLLPLGSTWQIGMILGIVVSFFVQLAMLVMFLVSSLFAWIMSLFGQPPPMPEVPLTEVPAERAMAMFPSIALPPWLGGTAFWIAVVAAVVLALRFIVGKEGLDLTIAKLQRGWAQIWARLRARWAELGQAARGMQLNLTGRGPASDLAAPGRSPWRFIRVGGLPPREQVRYFYLSAVRRAAGQGVARQPSQTPGEFVRDLESQWPEAELDVEALTEAFEIARYDAVEISKDEAQEVKSIWQRVKQALRGQRQPPGSE